MNPQIKTAPDKINSLADIDPMELASFDAKDLGLITLSQQANPGFSLLEAAEAAIENGLSPDVLAQLKFILESPGEPEAETVQEIEASSPVDLIETKYKQDSEAHTKLRRQIGSLERQAEDVEKALRTELEPEFRANRSVYRAELKDLSNAQKKELSEVKNEKNLQDQITQLEARAAALYKIPAEERNENPAALGVQAEDLRTQLPGAVEADRAAIEKIEISYARIFSDLRAKHKEISEGIQEKCNPEDKTKELRTKISSTKSAAKAIIEKQIAYLEAAYEFAKNHATDTATEGITADQAELKANLEVVRKALLDIPRNISDEYDIEALEADISKAEGLFTGSVKEEAEVQTQRSTDLSVARQAKADKESERDGRIKDATELKAKEIRALEEAIAKVESDYNGAAEKIIKDLDAFYKPKLKSRTDIFDKYYAGSVVESPVADIEVGPDSDDLLLLDDLTIAEDETPARRKMRTRTKVFLIIAVPIVAVGAADWGINGGKLTKGGWDKLQNGWSHVFPSEADKKKRQEAELAKKYGSESDLLVRLQSQSDTKAVVSLMVEAAESGVTSQVETYLFVTLSPERLIALLRSQDLVENNVLIPMIDKHIRANPAFDEIVITAEMTPLQRELLLVARIDRSTNLVLLYQATEGITAEDKSATLLMKEKLDAFKKDTGLKDYGEFLQQVFVERAFVMPDFENLMEYRQFLEHFQATFPADMFGGEWPITAADVIAEEEKRHLAYLTVADLRNERLPVPEFVTEINPLRCARGESTLVVTSAYKYRVSREARDVGGTNNGWHRAVDVRCKERAGGINVPTPDTAVVAPYDLTFVKKGRGSRLGHYVELKLPNGIEIIIGHLKSASEVEDGTTMKAGQYIADMGKSGSASAPHAHVVVRYDDRWNGMIHDKGETGILTMRPAELFLNMPTGVDKKDLERYTYARALDYGGAINPKMVMNAIRLRGVSAFQTEDWKSEVDGIFDTIFAGITSGLGVSSLTDQVVNPAMIMAAFEGLEETPDGQSVMQVLQSGEGNVLLATRAAHPFDTNRSKRVMSTEYQVGSRALRDLL